MEILPLYILDHDREGILFGEDIINLSKLIRNEFPTLKGFVVTPPEIVIQTVLKHLENKKTEVIEQSLTLVAAEINQIPIPEEFSKQFPADEVYLFNGVVIKSRAMLWKLLLNNWIENVKQKILRQGFSDNLKRTLTPQVIFKVPQSDKKLINSQFNLVKAFYSPDSMEVNITSSIKLTPPVLNMIDKLVLVGNQKIFIPQDFLFLITDKVYLLKVTPFTHLVPGSTKQEIVLPKKEILEIKKSAVKIFWDLSVGFTTPNYLDGILIDSNKFQDLDSLIFKVSEVSVRFPHKSLIFKLPQDQSQNYIKSLELLYKQKYLQNIELCLTNVHLPSELGNLKQQIVSLNPPRLWVEFFIPENFLNYELISRYKFDGIIINLDLLQRSILGVDQNEENYDKTQITGLINFLQPFFKVFHHDQKLVLVCGRLSLNPDVLDFLVSSGVWGVVSNNLIEAHSLPEHLNWVETRVVRKRVSD